PKPQTYQPSRYNGHHPKISSKTHGYIINPSFHSTERPSKSRKHEKALTSHITSKYFRSKLTPARFLKGRCCPI
ncbi:MAG: hypothetical protein QXN87_08845, partial [Candidatus Bathyarchaeia archaeon]